MTQQEKQLQQTTLVGRKIASDYETAVALHENLNPACNVQIFLDTCIKLTYGADGKPSNNPLLFISSSSFQPV